MPRYCACSAAARATWPHDGLHSVRHRHMTAMTVDEHRCSFEAVIVPHRSLGTRGLRWLRSALGRAERLGSVGLWLAGAWPVIGFTGLEAALGVWLLRRHAVGRRASRGAAAVRRRAADHPDGRAARRSEMQVPTSAGCAPRSRSGPAGRPRCCCAATGVAMEVATSLGESEKRDLAELRSATRWTRQRNPVFDNPQLRE